MLKTLWLSLCIHDWVVYTVRLLMWYSGSLIILIYWPTLTLKSWHTVGHCYRNLLLTLNDNIIHVTCVHYRLWHCDLVFGLNNAIIFPILVLVQWKSNLYWRPPVLKDHLPYKATFICQMGWSYNTGFTVYVYSKTCVQRPYSDLRPLACAPNSVL